MTFAIANSMNPNSAETTANTNTTDHVAILRAWCAENLERAWADELEEETDEDRRLAAAEADRIDSMRPSEAEPSRWEALRPCGDHCVPKYGVGGHPG